MDEQSRSQIARRLANSEPSPVPQDPQLVELARLLSRCPPFDRDQAICQDAHPPMTGLASLSQIQGLPAVTQYFDAEIEALEPQQEGQYEIQFTTAGPGLVVHWYGDAITYDAGAFAADRVIQRSALAQLSWKGGQENLITNSRNATWAPCSRLFPTGTGPVPFVRIVGGTDILTVRARNAFPVAAGSPVISVGFTFGFISAADLFSALHRIAGG